MDKNQADECRAGTESYIKTPPTPIIRFILYPPISPFRTRNHHQPIPVSPERPPSFNYIPFRERDHPQRSATEGRSSLFSLCYLYLSLFISIYLYLSLFVSICLYLSLFVSICLYLSLFVSIYLYLSLFISIYLYLSLFISIRFARETIPSEVPRWVGRFLGYTPVLAAHTRVVICVFLFFCAFFFPFFPLCQKKIFIFISLIFNVLQTNAFFVNIN